MATCLYCGNNYDLIKGFGKHCSRSCSLKTGHKGIWKQAELNLLQSLVGTKPIAQIISEWNSIAREKGWIERTGNAVKVKATRLFKGKTVKATQDNLSFTTLAKRLNIVVDRIQSWELTGLKVQNYSIDCYGRSHIKCVSKAALTQFARDYPDQLWGISKNALENILLDKALARAIFKTVNQPTIGRKIAVVDLINCTTHPSSKSAAAKLGLCKSAILHNAKCDFKKGDYHKHDFAQLDYPIWWITREHASIMHEVAGSILCQLQGEYIAVEGYKKQSFLKIAVCLAVRMAITSLRHYFNEYGDIPSKDNSQLNSIVERLKNFNYAFYEKFNGLSPERSHLLVHQIIKSKTANLFHARIADKRKVDLYLDEFASECIEYFAKAFKRKEFLPSKWNPKTATEYVFYWASILMVVLCAKREIHRYSEEPRKVTLRVLMAYSFIQKNGLEFSTLERQEYLASHQGQNHTIETFESELIDFIKAKCDPREVNTLETIISALSHGFSDQEIAMQLEFSKQRYFEYKEKLQLLTKEFMGSVAVF